MFENIYSIRDNIETVDVFEYEEVNKKLKMQLFYLMKDNLNIVKFVKLYELITMHHGLPRGISETYLKRPDIFQENFIKGFENLIDDKDNIGFYLDLIELFLNEYKEEKGEVIKSINKILFLSSLGYQVDEIKYQIIRIDSSHSYQEIITPALILLNDVKFQNVDDEYRKAFAELKDGNYEGVLVEGNKAFESTMKIICDLKGYELPKRHTATALIAKLREKDFITNFQDEKFNGLAKTLESISITRNNQAGHGQGSESRNLPIIFSEYALRVTASNILLLIGIYNESV